MPSTTLTIDQLVLSPLNVRTAPLPAGDTDALEASIAENGLRDPLHVHPLKGSKGKWGVIDGQRRYRSIKALVGRGQLAADWPVPVHLHDDLSDAELVELSMAENLLRRDLHVHELVRGVARAARLGHDVETIARNLGQANVREVARWHRLGRLPEPIFNAFLLGPFDDAEEEEDMQAVAKAYAATEDQKLQLAVFERLSAGPEHFHHADAVRHALGYGDWQQARALTFVGEAVYRAAGGAWELDLFADSPGDRGRVTDPPLLTRLLEEKLATVRDETRTAVGDPGLTFLAEKPKMPGGGYTDYTLEITVKRRPDGTVILPKRADAGDIAAFIEIDPHGAAAVTFWWTSRKAKFGGEKAEGKTAPVSAGPIGDALADEYRTGARAQADAAIKEEAGLSQDNIVVARAMRKQILLGLLIDDAHAGGNVATDYLVWSQLRIWLGRRNGQSLSTKLAIRPIAEPNTVGITGALQKITDALGEQPGTHLIAQALFELEQQTFVTSDDLGDAFLDYRCSADSLKRLAAAVVTGMALEGSLDFDGYRRAAHDAMVWEMIPPMAFVEGYADSQVRRHWTPTRTFLAALPKAQLLAIVEPLVDAKTHAAWAKHKTAELLDHVARVLDGAHPSLRADAREAAARWVHPLLRFEPPPRDEEVGDPVDDEEEHNANDELREAAE
jgi:ParB family transcriptional regulator, chromosome partitioning protein